MKEGNVRGPEKNSESNCALSFGDLYAKVWIQSGGKKCEKL